MPIPTEYEVLCLNVIKRNAKYLEDALHHENSVYEQLNKRALEDAELYSRTGRIKTPSPPPSSNSDGDLPKCQPGKSGDTECTNNPKGHFAEAALAQGFQVPTSQVVVDLSSDSEVKFCCCKQVSKQCDKNTFSIEPPDGNTFARNSNCDAGHSESNTQNHNTVTSSQCGGTEKDFILATNTRIATDSNSLLVQRRTQRTSEKTTNRYHRSNVHQIRKNKMVAFERSEGLPESSLAKKKSSASKPRETRARSKAHAGPEGNVSAGAVDMSSGRGRRKNVGPTGVDRLKGKKKGKPLSPAVVDVVFGKLQSAVPDVDELRRKREEDSLRCGRVVRTVGGDLNQINSPMPPRIVSHENALQKDVTATMQKESMNPSGNSLPNVISTDFVKRSRKAFIDSKEEVNEEDEGPAVDELLKETREAHIEQQVGTPERTRSPVPRVVLQSATQEDHEFEPVNPSSHVSQNCRTYSQNPASDIHYHDTPSRMKEGIQNVSQRQGPPSQRQHSHDASRRSPREDPPASSRRIRSKSLECSPRRSPVHQRRRYESSETRTYEEPESRRRLPHQSRHENTEDQLHRQSRDLSYNNIAYRHRRSLSAKLNDGQRRGSNSYEKTRSPSVLYLPESEKVAFQTERRDDIRRTTDLVVSSSSVERRTRRYRLAVREVGRSERNQGGKKPFYLTLNSEGIPYGPGKPAWVAEVNKLATGLDPSVTHIRKQTHEDMCILKDRLDDHFEYSGELNQDHLRALLGKAVTRRRTELISYIRGGGRQPVTMDIEVWKRLENLSCSRQRESRSEHGWHANACRRTLGRTGAIGVDGVRQRLTEFYGSSPDPDEVAEEMERDKGYSKKDLERRRTIRKEIGGSHVDVGEAKSKRKLPQDSAVEAYSSDGGRSNRELSLIKVSSQGRNPQGSVNDPPETLVVDSGIISTADYIAQLESQLRIFREGSGKGSSSRKKALSDHPSRGDEDYDGWAGGHVAGTSAAAGHRRLQRNVVRRHDEVEYDEG